MTAPTNSPGATPATATAAEVEALRVGIDARFSNLMTMLEPILASHISEKAKKKADAVVEAQVMAQNPGPPGPGGGRRPDTVLFQALNSGFATLADLLSQIAVTLQAQGKSAE